MSVTTAASSARRRIRSSLGRWNGSLESSDQPLFREFVKHTLGRLRGPFLARHRPREVLSYLEEAFKFALVRPKDEARVEVQPGPEKGLVVLTCMPDQPFIVDTVRLFLRRGDCDYWGGFNLVFHAIRDAHGQLTGVGDAGKKESLVLLEADGGTLLSDLPSAADELRTALGLSRSVVTDFKAMTRTVDRTIEHLEVMGERQPDQADRWHETALFLKWLLRENFVFMGMETPVTSLGIQSPTEGRSVATPEGDWPPPHRPGTIFVRKSREESQVHRAGRIDEIKVQDPESDGEPLLFIRGMFTYRAVTQPCRHVPILRRVLASVLGSDQATPGSFRYKGIANVFDSLPTEFLFTASERAIGEMVDLIFEAEQQQEVHVTFLMTGEDTAFWLIAMPKTEYSDELRRDLENLIVSTLDATYSDHGLFVGRYDTVLLHYYMTGITLPDETALKRLTVHIQELATPWHARLFHALSGRYDDTTAERLTDTYGRAFPRDWIRSTTPERAVDDIEMLESLSGRRSLVARVLPSDNEESYLRIYQATNTFLTDLLPVLDNIGLIVVDAYPTDIKSRGGSLFMDTFRVRVRSEEHQQVLRQEPERVVNAIASVFAGDATNDPLNALVLTAGLSWRDVDVLRGYVRYLRQLRGSISLQRAQEILLNRARLCHLFIELFHTYFDPNLDGSRAAKTAEAEEALDDELRQLRKHDEDVLFRSLTSLLRGTIRTNYYRAGRDRYYLSFKFDCAQIPEYGRMRPRFEIYVHHREVEGVHLRFGPVARGGLRWSDRDDYRTEVLGLATTQQVKNVVIVPDGAKGGFQLKNPPLDAATARREADRLYKTFISGLLDVTDNTIDGVVITPDGIVPRDGPDPYLVVAADKGTAHLSDTANALSQRYGFWLGDAFASGGSNGYDHKGVGITARGAWQLVRRHFAETGRDPYSEPFTCVGIGDMGGDVFGNGLIETDQARLLAAFNHRHVFLDPNPDTAASYVERKRLFEAGRQGGWDHYDPEKISEGGGVFDRTEKAIELSPAAREMLGIEESSASPERVIRHILRMDVDLLWNGGIGTYVKASHETDEDAKDRSNDHLRVDASELRCGILGEGGNLGLTTAARIEAGQRGVRLNADFIDNAGGVDLSDHEVNLKILLGPAVTRGELGVDDRNELLRDMTEEVAQLVLDNNDRQGRQLSRDEIRSKTDLYQFARAIAFIEDQMDVTRDQLQLPTEAVLEQRASRGEGMTRPELAVISSWVKMFVSRALLESDITELHGYDDLLTNYFPPRLRETYAEDIRGHLLAKEIAATEATNRIVADAGAAFFPVMMEATGRNAAEIATAYLKAQQLAHTNEARSTLEELRTSVSLNALYRAWTKLDEGTVRVAQYWLSAQGHIPSDAELTSMASAIDTVYRVQSSAVVEQNSELLRELLADEIPHEVALRILKAQYLNTALMVWSESRRTGRPLPEVAITILAIGRASGLQRVLDTVKPCQEADRWEPIGLRILERRFTMHLRALVENCDINVGGSTVDDLVPRLTEGEMAHVRQQVDAMLTSETSSVASLLVLEARVAAVVQRLRR